jgi:hypothetical protein
MMMMKMVVIVMLLLLLMMMMVMATTTRKIILSHITAVDWGCRQQTLQPCMQCRQLSLPQKLVPQSGYRHWSLSRNLRRPSYGAQKFPYRVV